MRTRMLGPLYSGAAAGGAGVATANASTGVVVEGRIIAIGVKYLDSPPAGTTDLIIATTGDNGPVQTLLSLSNAATDGWFYPRVGTVSPTGAALLHDVGGSAVAECFAINDKINVKIEQANANDGANVWILME